MAMVHTDHQYFRRLENPMNKKNDWMYKPEMIVNLYGKVMFSYPGIALKTD